MVLRGCPATCGQPFLFIKTNTGNILNYNPMKTEAARKVWNKKQEMVRLFIQELETDLNISE